MADILDQRTFIPGQGFCPLARFLPVHGVGRALQRGAIVAHVVDLAAAPLHFARFDRQ